ncbi:MAG: MarR family winged helix-turn-helix transcriptional regulator [Candidatus Dormibacteraceae bacterium]
MPSVEQRADLAAMLAPLARALVAAELPALERAGLSMWAYIVLSRLNGGPAATQAGLAAEIGADKTRLIPVLDDLQARGLIERFPDPTDRRRRTLRATGAGVELQARAQALIRRHESEVLAHLDAGDRAAFLRALATLSALPRETLLSSPGPGRAAR